MDKDSDSIKSFSDAPTSGRILSMDMGKHVADCYQGENAPCRSACPLDLDVPKFITKLQRGNFKSAYNLFRDHSIFPEIVQLICDQPCMGACARKDAYGAINLKKLERAAADFAGSITPVRYNIPKKNKNVAIVGAGLCGLSCMARLVSHGYSVVVFEKTGRIGGYLWELFPDGRFMKEIDLQTRHLDYELRLEAFVTSMDDLCGFDAVLLACGNNGEDFGLLSALNRDSLGSVQDGIFLGGRLVGSSPVESIENGLRASQSIESYLKIGRMHEMTGVSVKRPSRLKVSLKHFQFTEQPESDVYTKEQAMQEAACCPRCDCGDCMRSCDFMKVYNKLPKKIVNDVRVRLNPVEGLQGSTGTRMINSCNACGLCSEVCSENIDMGEFLLEAKSIMHREGSLPPVFHEFWMRDMHHAQSEGAHLARCAPGYEKSRYLFFPGCQLGASDPAYVEKTYEYLREKLPDTGLLLSCCGAPAEWAGAVLSMEETAGDIRKVWESMGRPEIIFACPSCKKMFRKYLPEIRQVSLYEVIRRHGTPGGGHMDGDTVSVFDPCSSRYDPEMQESVRELISMTGRVIEELPTARREAACCGFGGHIYPANRDLAENISKNRAKLGPRPFVTYCANCRDILSRSGKNCVHVLNLVFGIGSWSLLPPSLSRRRDNRESLKKDLLRQVWGQDVVMEEKKSQIVLATGLEEKLDKHLILEDDIRRTITYCEKNGTQILDTETGRFIGHCRLGNITYWVEYLIDNGRFMVWNVYSHRMRIEEEGHDDLR